MPSPSLSVQHLVYSRVEAAYSPLHSSGYQVVYHSPSLPATAVAQIERRVQCFQTQGQDVDRYQFFWIDADLAVVTKSVLLDPDREVVDRDERDGAFVAHALVLGKAALAHIGNDPFALISAAERERVFIDDVAALVACRHTPPHPQISVAVPRTAATPPQAWSKEALWQLALLAERAPEMARQKQPLHFVAETPDDTLDLLSALLQLCPPSARAACTFDTHVDACVPPPGVFWATGGTKRLTQTQHMHIYVNEGRVPSASDPPVPLTPYATWLRQTLTTAATFADVSRELAAAQMMAEGFATGQPFLEPAVPESTLAQFRDLNRVHIDQVLAQSLSPYLPQAIIARLLPVLDHYIPLQQVLSSAAVGAWDPSVLSAAVYTWVQALPDFDAWDDLKTLASAGQFARLLFLVGVKTKLQWPVVSDWLRPLDRGDTWRRAALEMLVAQAQLPQVLDELHALIDPAEFVSEASIPAVVAFYQTLPLADEVFAKLVQQLVHYQGAPHVHHFLAHVARLQNPKSAKQVLATVQKSKAVDPVFTATVKQRVAELS